VDLQPPSADLKANAQMLAAAAVAEADAELKAPLQPDAPSGSVLARIKALEAAAKPPSIGAAAAAPKMAAPSVGELPAVAVKLDAPQVPHLAAEAPELPAVAVAVGAQASGPSEVNTSAFSLPIAGLEVESPAAPAAAAAPSTGIATAHLRSQRSAEAAPLAGAGVGVDVDVPTSPMSPVGPTACMSPPLSLHVTAAAWHSCGFTRGAAVPLRHTRQGGDLSSERNEPPAPLVLLPLTPPPSPPRTPLAQGAPPAEPQAELQELAWERDQLAGELLQTMAALDKMTAKHSEVSAAHQSTSSMAAQLQAQLAVQDEELMARRSPPLVVGGAGCRVRQGRQAATAAAGTSAPPAAAGGSASRPALGGR
jgi:hypothetical protein